MMSMFTKYRIARSPVPGAAIAFAVLAGGFSVAHEIKLVGDPLPGSGYTAGALAPTAGKVLDFPAEGVELLSWLTSADMTGEVQQANDIWGYVSPSGREYAIIGIFNGTAFVEVTDPERPHVVKLVPGPGSAWRDIAVYREYAYIVNETGGGVQIVDLRKIDRGKVRKRGTVTSEGLLTAHNISINAASGYAYLSGSNLAGGGLVALDLSDPVAPVLKPEAWAEHYVHDALVVTFDRGPRAGREIAFAFAAESGVQIVDVTDKADMHTVANVRYPGLAYCHSGWIDRKGSFLLVNDELDEIHEADHDPEEATSRTYILNVRNLERARHVKTVTNGVTSIDHNTMTRGKRLYAANYQSGFRVFNARRPTRLREIAFFDTYPEADDVQFAGAWGVFSDFPSGIVVVSDINRGLFVFLPPDVGSS
jgi:choice-of-anchor B domain-containing protein